MESTTTEQTLSRRIVFEGAAAALVVVVFFERTVVSWRRWPDVVVDFGRELYTPWRLSQGAVLYRDVAHLSGPLSPGINALWFRLFGTSLTVLATANLAILTLLVVALYVVLRRFVDLASAVVGCVTLLVLFGFGHFLPSGNYNFVCPYAHELTHGIVLLAILLGALVGRRSRLRDAAAGVCLGLLFLGKPETFAAGVLVTLASLLLTGRMSLLARAGWIGLGGVVPLLAGFGILAIWRSGPEAASALVAAWQPVLAGRSANNAFYRSVTGIDAPVLNLLKLARGFVVGGCLIGALCLAARAFRNGLAPRYLLLAIPCAAAAWLFKTDVPAFLFGTTLIGFAAAAGFVGLLLRREPGGQAVFLTAVLALGLAAKILLWPRIEHYGFALMLPAGILAAVGLVGLVPALLRRRGASPRELLVLRVLACLVLLHDIAAWRSVADHFYGAKTLAVGDGGDRMYAYAPPDDWRGSATVAMLDWIRNSAPPGEFVVFPDAAMLNYLSRRPSPVPYVSYMPAELPHYGEEAIVESLNERPPAFVVFFHRDFGEYGLPPFGEEGNGGRIARWLAEQYAPAIGIRDQGEGPVCVVVFVRKT
jgi:hypothetical protein